jgi:hypothetical protein
MGNIVKGLALALVLVMAISSASVLVVKSAKAQSPETQNFTYIVSNYAVNYSIVSSKAGYYLLVYQNYPPFNIEISFYDGNQKVTAIAGTNSYSSSFTTTNYPTQITMKVTNEPASTPSPIIRPTVPEFSIRFVDSSYDIPANTSVDPFTGKTVTNPGQHINNQTITVTIKNQITLIFEGSYLHYQIQMKGHYSQEWTNISSFIQANPNSEYSILTYAVDGNNASGQFDSYLNQIPSGGTADFRVQAQLWVTSSNPYQMPMSWMESQSDWSPTQTITLTDGATSSSISSSLPSSPTATPAVPELSWPVIVPLLLSVFSVAVVLRHRKNR